jgi:hypothetical protein
LTNGNLGDFSSIHRGGDIDYSKDDQKVTLTLPIAFDDLAVSFRSFQRVQSNFSKIFRSPTTTVPKLWVLDPLEESKVA